jgi:hypothetical protein
MGQSGIKRYILLINFWPVFLDHLSGLQPGKSCRIRIQALMPEIERTPETLRVLALP